MMKFEELKKGMIFQNVKTEKTGKIIETEKTGKTVLLEDGLGNTKNISYSTLRRWYVYLNIMEVAEEKEEAPAKKEKERKQRVKKEMSADAQSMHEYVLKTCADIGGTVFVPAKDMKFRGLKAGKHMFIKYHWNNSRIILQVRAQALGLEKPKNPANHTFNDKYIFSEDTEENRAEIFRIMKTAYDWQVCHNLAREEKKTKKKTNKEKAA